MTIPRQQTGAEKELMAVLSSAIWKDPFLRSDCPNTEELHSFVRGKVGSERRDRLIDHMSSCDRCIAFLRKRRERRVLFKEASMAFAAITALLIALWMGFDRPAEVVNETATIDLRPIFLTRGGEAVMAAGDTAVIKTTARQLRLVLPSGSEGFYECDILDGRGITPLLRSSGDASLEDHQVVLNVPIQSPPLPAGQYTLGLRKSDSQWIYYPLILKRP